jgi:hypothetical protein
MADPLPERFTFRIGTILQPVLGRTGPGRLKTRLDPKIDR